jgi:hypothetical protein
MALDLNLDAGGRVYFTITCDDCHELFACYDDGCYSLQTLRNEAVFAGWDAAARPQRPHRCPDCEEGLGPGDAAPTASATHCEGCSRC